MERRKERPRKLEEFGNAGFLAPENAKRRVSHRISRSLRRCFLSRLLFSSRFTRRVILARAKRAVRSAVEIPTQVYVT